MTYDLTITVTEGDYAGESWWYSYQSGALGERSPSDALRADIEARETEGADFTADDEALTLTWRRKHRGGSGRMERWTEVHEFAAVHP